MKKRQTFLFEFFLFSFFFFLENERKSDEEENECLLTRFKNDLKVPNEVQRENRKVHGNGSIRPLFVHSKFSTSAALAKKKRKKTLAKKERMHISPKRKVKKTYVRVR